MTLTTTDNIPTTIKEDNTIDIIIDVRIGYSYQVGDLLITHTSPIDSLTNRTVLFPDFGIEIGNDTIPSPAPSPAELEEEKKVGLMIARKMLDTYPELLDQATEEELVDEIATLYVESWVRRQDLDLRRYRGLEPHGPYTKASEYYSL